jgi:hypothetical protein
MASGTSSIEDYEFKDGYRAVLDETYDSYSEKYGDGEYTYSCILLPPDESKEAEEGDMDVLWDSGAYPTDDGAAEALKRFGRTVESLKKKHDKEPPKELVEKQRHVRGRKGAYKREMEALKKKYKDVIDV